jgi:hypothetical protein
VLRCASLLLLVVLGVACRNAEADRAEVAEAVSAGDAENAEDVLRAALGRHPKDALLLAVAAEFYLRPEPDDLYRPRRALHYAMRADRAANYASDDVGRTLMRAYRAVGGIQGTELGQRLIEDGLNAVHHPDRADPKRLQKVDRDLLDPSLANILEQDRRDRRRAEGATPCGAGFVHVPSGTYPPTFGGDDLVVEAYCVARPAAGGGAQIADTVAARAAVCDALGDRLCTPAEAAVACGPLRTVVGRHITCEDARVVRCCADAEPL